jgi:phosphoribosylformylglycinamidine cyclo-ligase
MSGTALGWLPKGEAITGENLQDGDVLIGLPSSGIHSNGFSLVRKVIEVSGANINEAAPFSAEHSSRIIERFSEGEITLGEVLLNPTRIYCDPLVDLIKACRSNEGPCGISDLHAIAHITGGGLSNLLRLHDSLGYHISNPMSPQPEFTWVQQTGGISEREMYRTFNMGVGMMVATPASTSQAVLNWLNGRLKGCQIVGEVVDNGHKVTHINPEIVFEHY